MTADSGAIQGASCLAGTIRAKGVPGEDRSNLRMDFVPPFNLGEL